MRTLAIFSFSFAIAVAGANYVLPQGWLLPLGLMCLLLCPVLYRMLRGKIKPRLFWSIAAAGVAVGLLWTAAYTHVVYRPVQALDDRTVVLSGVVSDWPQEASYGYYVMADVDGGAPLKTSTLIYTDDQGADLRPGDRIEAIVHCTLADRTFSGEEITYYTAKGIFLRGVAYGKISVKRPERTPIKYLPAVLSKALKEGIDASFPEQDAGLIKALVTGNRDNLTDAFTSSLQRTGLLHIVSVSGMHVAFLAGMLSMLLGRGRRRTALIMIPTVLLFMTVAGNTPSVVRASVMIIMLQIAPLFRRERDSATSLGFAMLLLLLQNPFSVTHVGLQLSFTAVGGILLFSDKIKDWLLGKLKLKTDKRLPIRIYNRIIYFVAATFSATIGATVLTTPLVMYYFKSVSLVAPLANLLTLWAIGWAFGGGILAGLAGALSPAVGKIVALPMIPLCRYLEWVVPKLSRLPFAAITGDSIYYMAWLVFVYIMLALLVIKGKKRPVIPITAGAVTLVLSLMLTVSTFRNGDMTVTLLDVGQGQSVLLRMGHHLTLVDCGGDSTTDGGDVAANYLQDVGISSLDLLVITHYHADHANGVPQLLERVNVSAIAMPDVEEDTPLRQTIEELADEKGIELWYINEDKTVDVGETMTLNLFAPLGAGDTNEEGLTILASVAGGDVLITGDMDGSVEQKLIAHTTLPDIEVLVVGHHGSKYSTTQELLDATTPEIALISVGLGNRYGHPDESTLARLTAAELTLYRTDLNGTITIHVK